MDYPYRVAAQINMYPMDFPHVEHLLAHQIRVWAPMTDRIVVTIDTHRSRSGRYRGNNFDTYLSGLRKLTEDFKRDTPQLEVVEVDYSPQARRAVAQQFFGSEDMPVKAWDGGPFYAYFYGMHHARARYIAHFDGDMLFGGGSTTWVEDAIAFMEKDTRTLLTSPLPGPPAADGRVHGHGSPEPTAFEVNGGPAYRFQHASTRIFMLDMERLRTTLGTLPLMAPDLLSQLKARILGNPPDVREAEVILGKVLRNNDLYRVDMLGAQPGLWSLHPPYRGANFYARLPALIEAVESGQVPSAQHGHYDVHDSLVDWSSERERTRRSRRLWRLFKDRMTPGA